MYGIINVPTGVVTLFAATLAAYIYNQTKGVYTNEYLAVILYSGVFMTLSGVVGMTIRFSVSRKIFVRV